MSDREDVAELFVSSILNRNVLRDTKTDQYITDFGYAKSLFKKTLKLETIAQSEQDLFFLPNYNYWVFDLIKIVREVYPGPHDIFNCTATIERTNQLVKEEWEAIEMSAKGFNKFLLPTIEALENQFQRNKGGAK